MRLHYLAADYDAAALWMHRTVCDGYLHGADKAPCVCFFACPLGDRWSADHYLTSWPRQLFPPYFSDVLHPFFSKLLPLDPDARLAAVARHFKQLTAAVQGKEGGGSTGGHTQQIAVRVCGIPVGL